MNYHYKYSFHAMDHLVPLRLYKLVCYRYSDDTYSVEECNGVEHFCHKVYNGHHHCTIYMYITANLV